jgi:hypothetical protein
MFIAAFSFGFFEANFAYFATVVVAASSMCLNFSGLRSARYDSV